MPRNGRLLLGNAWLSSETVAAQTIVDLPVRVRENKRRGTADLRVTLRKRMPPLAGDARHGGGLKAVAAFSPPPCRRAQMFSGTILIAPQGHSETQTPQPLQYS